MSKSYPPSSIWPFVLSGVLLFGLVICPPSKVAPEVEKLFRDFQAGYLASPVHAAYAVKSPKITVHDPWDRQVAMAAEPARSYTPLEPAPTWNLPKATSIAQEPGNSDLVDSALARILPSPNATSGLDQSPDRLALNRLTTLPSTTGGTVHVWQPPQNWVPGLIEPLPVSKSSHHPVPVAALTPEPVAAPVAKLDALERSPQKQPAYQEPVLLDPPSLDPPSLNPPSLSTRTRDSNLGEMEPSLVPEPELEESRESEGSEKIATIQEPLADPNRNDGDLPSGSLARLLRLGTEQPRLAKWSEQLQEMTREFRSQPVRGTDRQRQLVARMSQWANYPVQVDQWTAIEQELYWRIRHAMQRRTDVWQPLLTVATEEEQQATRAHARMQAAAGQLADRLSVNSATRHWADYLMLRQLASSLQPHVAAETTLRRLRSSQLSASQQAFLAAPEFGSLEQLLRTSISYGVSAEQLTVSLERYEDQTDSASASALLASLQRFSNGTDTQRFSSTIDAIDTHYRNANLRVSVSEKLVNRLVPAMHQYAEQVQDTILGARVQGQNATQTQLAVHLLPDERAIRMELLARGQVHSNTASRKGPVIFYNRGQSEFAAGKQLVIAPEGISLGATETHASTGNRVVGMRTDWDEMPILGWMVRSIARQQHEDQRPFLRAEVLRRVRRQTSSKLDDEVQRRVANAEQQVQSRIVQPLQRLQLDPRAMEMRTTEDRAILRTRLASSMQFGSHTPRPRALRDSKLSFQVHQTAANNLIDQWELDGRSMTLGELGEELSTRFGMNLEIEERRRSTVVEFAKSHPIEFDFQDDKVEITIHFAKLDHGTEQWKNFSVRGFYRADVQRMDIELVREGSIELVTETLRLRDQVALRSIFTKVFDANPRIDLLRQVIQDHPRLKGLEVTQLTIRDGWISASVGETLETPRMAAANIDP